MDDYILRVTKSKNKDKYNLYIMIREVIKLIRVLQINV